LEDKIYLYFFLSKKAKYFLQNLLFVEASTEGLLVNYVGFGGLKGGFGFFGGALFLIFFRRLKL